MKNTFKLLTTAASAAMLLASPALQAESTYGYNPAGVAGATATARVNITVTVPTLILLRVGGNAGTVDTVTLAAQPTGIPGGVLSPLGVGDNQLSGWDGLTPPTLAAAPTTLTASAWTNSPNGGNVTGLVTTAFPVDSGLTDADIVVTSGTGTLAHPGANTSEMTTGTAFARNTVVSSTWAYSLSDAGLANAAAGSHTQEVTYTATAL